MVRNLAVAAILKSTEYIGYTVHPYLYVPDEAQYVTIRERLTPLNIHTIDQLPDGAKELYELSQSLEPISLVDRFSTKKVTPKAFFAQKTQLLEEMVKPFADKQMVEMFKVIDHYRIPFYNIAALPNLYNISAIKTEHVQASTVLKFNHKEEGTTYSLEAFIKDRKINLQHPQNLIVVNKPCYLISNNRLIGFDIDITGKMLSPFLQNEYIEIPKRLENKYFSTFIKKIVTNSEIIAEGFVIRDAEVQPKAKVTFEKDWNGKAGLSLNFMYGEKAIFSSNKSPAFTELISNEEGFTFYRYKRDLKWEKEQMLLLQSYGLKRYEHYYRLMDNDSQNQVDDMIHWVISHKNDLQKNKFLMNFEFLNNYSLSVPQITERIDNTADYFDVNIVVEIDEYQIPFVQFKHYILKNLAEFPLPSGKIFLIPKSWFARYYDLLVYGQIIGKSLRLIKQHYPIIGKLDTSFDEEPFMSSDLTDIPEPVLYNVELRPYQIIGYQWLIRLAEMGFGGILADDMGLGKTLQTIALLASRYPVPAVEPKSTSQGTGLQMDLFSNQEPLPNTIGNDHPSTKPPIHTCSVVVMPASLIHNWVNEINKFAPFLRVLVYTGSNRNQVKNIFKNYDVLLTTYGTLRNDIHFLSKYNFAFAILDESQQIKNPGSKTAQAVFELRSKHKFALTGTPVENNLTDLWSQMNFVNSGLLGDLSVFNSQFAVPLAKDPEAPQATRLLAMIEPFVLRRTKESVAPELPSINETISYCTMSEDQEHLYETEKSMIRNDMLEKLDTDDIVKNPVMILKALMKLRQIANHPLMIDPESIIGSGKYDEVTEKLDTVVSENHRILIFSSFVKHLVIFENYCKEKGIDYTMLTGKTTNRGKVVSGFKDSSDKKVFLISLKAGGLGLNLTEADYIFVLDPWWNPAAEQQAISRAHRIGQDKNVFVYRFITKNTVEEKILSMQTQKKALAHAFVKPQHAISGMTREEILQLFE